MAEKGASMIVRDFKSGLMDVINRYQMPTIIKQQIVSNINNDLIKVMECEIANEEQDYKEALEKEEQDKDKKDKDKDKKEGADKECQSKQKS